MKFSASQVNNFITAGAIGFTTVLVLVGQVGAALATTGSPPPDPTAFSFPWLSRVPDPDNAGHWMLPAFEFYPDTGLIWRDGSIREASDITAHGDGSYTLNTVPSGLDTGATVYVEIEHTYGTPVTGTIYSQASNTTSLDGGIEITPVLSSGLPFVGFQTTHRAGANMSARYHSFGFNRFVVSIDTTDRGRQAKYLVDNKAIQTGVASTTYATPIRVAIGRLANNSAVLSGVTIKRVVIYAGYKSEAQIQAIMDSLDENPVPAQPAVIPDWVPQIKADNGSILTPLAHLDFHRGTAWFENSVHALTDVADLRGLTPNQQWVLKRPPRGLRASTGLAISTDFAPDEYWWVNSPSGLTGYVAQSFNAASAKPTVSNSRLQWYFNSSGGYGYNTLYCSYCSSPQYGFIPPTPPEGAGGPGVSGLDGIHRYLISVPGSGGSVSYSIDAFPQGTTLGTSSLSEGQVPSYFGFGGFFNGTAYSQPMELSKLYSATIWGRSLSVDEYFEAQTWNEYKVRPFWTHGDSYSNIGYFHNGILIHARRSGLTYLPSLRTGKGGQGLSYHDLSIAAWIAAWPKLAECILVLNEGGFDIRGQRDLSGNVLPDLTPLTAIQKINTIVQRFQDQRFVFMESQSNNAGSQIESYRTFLGAVKETFPDAWAPTIRLMQSQYTDQATYDAAVLAGLVPDSLRFDAVHLKTGTFSPTNDGFYWWSLAAFKKLSQIMALPVRN